jgi:hypothetical protein
MERGQVFALLFSRTIIIVRLYAGPLIIEYPDAYYHVINRRMRGENIFTACDDYKALIALLQEISEMFNLRVVYFS